MNTITNFDREHMIKALEYCRCLSRRDVIGAMMCDEDTARRRIIDAIDAITFDRIEDQHIITTRHAVIETAMSSYPAIERQVYRQLNVRLAAILEGVAA